MRLEDGESYRAIVTLWLPVELPVTICGEGGELQVSGDARDDRAGIGWPHEELAATAEATVVVEGAGERAAEIEELALKRLREAIAEGNLKSLISDLEELDFFPGTM